MHERALKLFYSYAHADEIFRRELHVHLAPLRHLGIVADWHDRKITAGSVWQASISKEIDAADMIVLLVSPDFIASEYCYGVELSRALERHKDGSARVIPVVVRACSWMKLPIAALQALPIDARPIATWSDRDGAYVDVVAGLERVAEELFAQRRSLVSDWVTSILLRRRVVRFVQSLLKEQGLYGAPIDGDPGPATFAAVRRFQQSIGVEADGLIGPDTLEVMQRSRVHEWKA